MPYPTTVRVLLGHFLHGVDLPSVSQSAPPLPVRSPTYLSLRAILADRARGGDARAVQVDTRAKGTAEGG